MILTDDTWILSFSVPEIREELTENNKNLLNPGFSKYSIYRIHLTKESNCFVGVPHFHITDNNDKVIVRIKLLKNQYKRDKDDPYNKLDSRTSKELEKFMHRISPQDGLNNWAYLCKMWNKAHSAGLIIPESAKQPNYTNILEDNK